LKPALEVILMVNKPLAEKTIVDNVLAHGVGAINVDACRIPFSQNNEDPRLGGKGDWSIEKTATNVYGDYKGEGRIETSAQGRFPANLLVSDKALDTGKITKANIQHHTENECPTGNALTHGKMKAIATIRGYNDVGDQSRYFDLDAWAEHHGFLDVAKASKAERNSGLEGFPKRVKTEKRRVEDQGGLQDRIHGKVPKQNFHRKRSRP